MKTRISEALVGGNKVLRGSGLVALLLLTMFISLTPARAQAQSSNTWKSIAIIGGSTAAGAIIGHEVGGRTGAYVGAAVGAGTGYAIDHRRRENQDRYYGNSGYYGDNGGYRDNRPYYGNGGYRGDSGYRNGPGYQNTGYYGNDNCRSRR